jgi:hypothetical protein
MPSRKGRVSPSSTMAADIVSVGDSWLNLAINKSIIEPIQGAEDQEWFKALSDKWKVRNTCNLPCLCRWTCAVSQTCFTPLVILGAPFLLGFYIYQKFCNLPIWNLRDIKQVFSFTMLLILYSHFLSVLHPFTENFPFTYRKKLI